MGPFYGPINYQYLHVRVQVVPRWYTDVYLGPSDLTSGPVHLGVPPEMTPIWTLFGPLFGAPWSLSVGGEDMGSRIPLVWGLLLAGPRALLLNPCSVPSREVLYTYPPGVLIYNILLYIYTRARDRETTGYLDPPEPKPWYFHYLTGYMPYPGESIK